MARPKKNDAQKKSIRRSVVFTDEEFKVIKDKVKKSGMSLSTYLLACGLNRDITPPIPHFDRLSLGKLAGIGNNLNQIAKHVNSAGLGEVQIGAILKETLELNQLLRDTLHLNSGK